jgi:4-hydroxy-3-polyprenylbenzoate decarboxylase
MFQARTEDISAERKPAAFGDLRGFIEALRAQGELAEIEAEVDWNIELGTVMRLAQGQGTGKALIFNNIKDYNAPTSRCRRIFGSALNNYRRIAMMLGLPPDTHPRELVKVGRTILTGSIAPKIVATGPVKENILKGADVDLYEFPTPHWNRLDGGRYLLTYGGCVTKDPETGIMNVGVYRGMVAGHDRIPILMWRAQHIGHHVTAWQRGGEAEMPIAAAIGWEPSLDFCAGAPVPKGVCEYDVVGAVRGAPVELVKCETVDLYVPATAEIVIEGYLGLDPATYMMEGPYAEFTGYLAGDRSPKPTIRVTAITHRNDPILRGTIEGAMPGSYSENAMCSSIMRAATAWNVLDRAGVPGVTDVWCPPVQAGINLLIQMKQSYRNQAKQAANAIWGSSAAHVRYKHITVVDDDIDIHDYAAVDWAIAHRVNAGENDVVIMPATFGLGLDPSVRKRDRNPTLFGTGKWSRVLIDATMNLDYDPDPDYGGARFPPTVWPDKDDVEKAYARWSELGLGKPKGTSE